MTSSAALTSRRLSALGSCLLSLAVVNIFAGCGGEDKGRVSGSVAVVPAVDQCALATQFDGGATLVDFESWESNGVMSTAARCNSVPASAPETQPIAVCEMNPFYFNHDEHTVLNAGEVPTCTSRPDTSDGTPSAHCSYCPRLNDEATFDPSVGGDLGGKPIPEGTRCGQTQRALHFEATNMGTCYGSNGRLGWGGSIEIKLLEFDASDYDGISFWVRKGNKKTGSSLLLSVVDNETLGTATGIKGEDHCGCLPPPPETPDAAPKCSADPDKDFDAFPDSLKCDPFGAAITVTDAWSFVPVHFSKLRQKGFGKAVPSGQVDRSALRRLQFLVNAGDWDFWLDDIALFRAPQ